MAQRRHHYDRVFEEFLRERQIPYVSVDEARKSLLPAGASRHLPAQPGEAGADGGAALKSLKSFDFVIYGQGSNLLVEVKGRKVPRRRRSSPASESGSRAGGDGLWPHASRTPRLPGRLESWVTEDDVRALRTWERLFGAGFAAAFVFVYWCENEPPDGLFQEVVASRGRWYALRSILVREYERAMKPRSVRWGTVDLPREAFDRLSYPFAPSARWTGDPADLGPEVPMLEPLASG